MPINKRLIISVLLVKEISVQKFPTYTMYVFAIILQDMNGYNYEIRSEADGNK